MKEQVMFGMMVSMGNIAQAEGTAAAFAQASGKDALLGVQTDDLVRDESPLLVFIENRRSEPWKGVFLWDKQCDDAWQSIWPASLPRPFYTGKDIFSYGGALNRLLVLALIAQAPVLVRVDAGTAPMSEPSFAASLEEHLALLDKYAVLSGRYDGRFALRDLKGVDRSAFHALVERRITVNPLDQITGGACFALRVEDGPPAIPFPGVLPVWASDDAFFQSAAPSFKVNPKMIVEREDPGQPLTGPEYLARLACAVALTAIHQKANLTLRLVPTLDTVVAAGKAFLDELRESFPDAVRASDHGGALCRLQERTLGLIEGYENYSELKPRWDDVRNHVATVTPTLYGHCHCK